MRHPRDVCHTLRAFLRIAGHVRGEIPGQSRNVEPERGKPIPAVLKALSDRSSRAFDRSNHLR
jgi:hypothetical protein